MKAAARALAGGSVELVLPYVPAESEREVREAFGKTMAARGSGAAAAEVADEWFCETVVRVHRAGEGAAFTGLKPAGLGHGEVVPVAERAIETGEIDELVELLTAALEAETRTKFNRVMHLKAQENGPVAEAREYVEAMLGFQVWAHKTHQCITSDPLHDHGAMGHRE
ncbi:MAG: DUF6448 family protein [Anaerosomatales bacterium]|nr:DUF6448 family protein [Anaerosomatales bacterium]